MKQTNARRRTANNERACGYCGKSGHNIRTCKPCGEGMARANELDARIAERAIAVQATKNPLHWERLRVARNAVAAELDAALGELSERSRAAKYISRALQLLEECR